MCGRALEQIHKSVGVIQAESERAGAASETAGKPDTDRGVEGQEHVWLSRFGEIEVQRTSSRRYRSPCRADRRSHRRSRQARVGPPANTKLDVIRADPNDGTTQSAEITDQPGCSEHTEYREGPRHYPVLRRKPHVEHRSLCSDCEEQSTEQSRGASGSTGEVYRLWHVMNSGRRKRPDLRPERKAMARRAI